MSVALIVVVCLASSGILIKRRVFAVEAGSSSGAKAGDIEEGQLNFVNEKVVTDEPRTAPEPQAAKESPAPAPLPVKDAAASQAEEVTAKDAMQQGPKIVSEVKPAKGGTRSGAPPAVREVENERKDFVSIDVPTPSRIVHL